MLAERLGYCIHMPPIGFSNVVVVGASLAGLRAAEGLRKAGYTGRVQVVGEEQEEPYDRTLLSKDLLSAGARAPQQPLRQAKDIGAEWLLGRRAVGLDTRDREVRLADGERLRYDGLVIATGAIARQLPGLPAAVPGVHTLRTLRDASELRASLDGGRRVAIVGAGFIGTEVASAARSRGLDTTLITPLPLLGTAMGQLSGPMSERVRRFGVTLLEGVSVVGLQADDRVRAVVLSDGTTRPADVVVVAVGAVPATGWLEGSGVKLDNGVICDESMAAVGLTDVVAAGDVARWPHPALGGATLRLEHWTNTAEQALAAGRRLASGTGPAFAPIPSFWSDQFGLKLQGVGFPGLADRIVLADGALHSDSWVVEFRRGDQLVGAVVAGQVKPLLAYRRELAKLERYPS